MEEILKNIVALRRKRGISQKDLGKRIGISQVNVSKMEKGLTHITVDRLLDIADILQVEVYDLLPPNKLLLEYDISLNQRILEKIKKMSISIEQRLNEIQNKLNQISSNENKTCRGTSPDA